MALKLCDYEVLDRKIHRPWGLWCFELCFGLVLALITEGSFDIVSLSNSEATWWLRHKTTGEERRVTADSESVAAEKVAKGYFDAD
jgi:hypothetical protein